MYIDFHIHAFTDSIAERAVSNLEETAKIEGFTRGTIAEAVLRLKEWGISKGVLLPIATKPKQQATINNWAKEAMDNNDSIISFGTIHPNSEDALAELVRIKEMGLKGVKFHPDYQDFMINDSRMFPIYQRCSELKLPAVFHAGYDPLSPDLIHAMPKASAEVLDMFPKLTVILAHMGGMNVWDDVERYLVGKNVYFDTAYIAGNMSGKQMEHMIKNHGADKLLLASDLPWHKTSDEIEFIDSLNLSVEEKEMIYYKNALRLLSV